MTIALTILLTVAATLVVSGFLGCRYMRHCLGDQYQFDVCSVQFFAGVLLAIACGIWFLVSRFLMA